MKNLLVLLFILTGFLLSCLSKVPVNEKKLSDWQLDSIKRIECDSLLSSLHKANADTIGQLGDVPKNLQESFVELDQLIGDGLKEWIKCLPDKEFGVYVHHGFGTSMRNNWGLWAGSELAQYMNLLGVFHPDDMSAIILDSYQRRLKGEDIRVEEQIEYYHDFWKENGVNVDSILREMKTTEKKKNK